MLNAHIPAGYILKTWIMRDDNVLKVYTGPIENATLIKEKLEVNGINTFQDDNAHFREPGKGHKNPESLDVYVYKKDLVRAQKVVEKAYIEFMDT